MTPYLYREPGRFRNVVTHYPHGDTDLRLTVDTPKISPRSRVVRSARPRHPIRGGRGHLREHPELKALNAHIEQKTLLGEDELRRQRIAGRLLLARADAGPSIGFGHVARTGALLEPGRSSAALPSSSAREAAVRRSNGSRASLGWSTRVPRPTRSWSEPSRPLQPRSSSTVTTSKPKRRSPRSRSAARLGRPRRARSGRRRHPQPEPRSQRRSVRRTPRSCARGCRVPSLRGEFRRARAGKALGRTEAPVERLVVAFGASDPAGLSPRVAALLCRVLPSQTRVTVIIGSGVSGSTRRELEALASQAAQLELLTDPPSVTDAPGAPTSPCSARGRSLGRRCARGSERARRSGGEPASAVTAGAREAGAAHDAGVLGPGALKPASATPCLR